MKNIKKVKRQDKGFNNPSLESSAEPMIAITEVVKRIIKLDNLVKQIAMILKQHSYRNDCMIKQIAFKNNL